MYDDLIVLRTAAVLSAPREPSSVATASLRPRQELSFPTRITPSPS